LRVFISTYESAIDAKGRVSIPAPFRAALGGSTRVFLWPALDGSGCLEGGGDELMAMYRHTITRLPPQSPARKALVNGLFARAADLKMDETGRIKLPDDLRQAAGLDARIVFAGNVDSFQVWNPDAHAAYDASMVQVAARDDTLATLGEAYDELQRAQLGGFPGLKAINGGES
jgi:MraZ protein